MQAVEKALRRKDGACIEGAADTLCIGYSTLQKWIQMSKEQEFDTTSLNVQVMTREKRSQDWSLEERLEMVIACGPLSDEAIRQLYREKGLYPHHVNQWNSDFAGGSALIIASILRLEVNQLILFLFFGKMLKAVGAGMINS